MKLWFWITFKNHKVCHVICEEMEISKKLKSRYAENRHLIPEVRKFAASGAFIGASVAGIGGIAAGMHGAGIGEITVYVGSAALVGAVGLGIVAFKELKRKE